MDINADVGEGIKIDSKLIPLLTSCNIACGGHAGNEESMHKTVALAKDHHVQIGAHPSFPDPSNFGRVEMDIPASTLFESIYSQISAIHKICKDQKTELVYVKPHGALYHSFNNSYLLSLEFVALIKNEFPTLKVLGFPNKKLHNACIDNQLNFIKEGFADRAYGEDHTLLKRTQVGAIINTRQQMKAHIYDYLLPTDIQSLCFHGDHPNTLELIHFLHDELASSNIEIRKF